MVRIIETALNEGERHVLKLLAKVAGQTGAYGITLTDGKMAEAGGELVRRGFAEQLCGYFHITDAGRSQLRSNLSE